MRTEPEFAFSIAITFAAAALFASVCHSRRWRSLNIDLHIDRGRLIRRECHLFRVLCKTGGIAAILMIALVGTVNAACYDILGCSNRNLFSKHFDYLASRDNGPNCDFLWSMRNAIFAENGYCFQSPRGISEIGNRGCRYSNITSVPLNTTERANIVTIERAERLKSCRP